MDFKKYDLSYWKSALVNGLDKKKWLFVGAFFVSVLVKMLLFSSVANDGLHLSGGCSGWLWDWMMCYSSYLAVALFFVAAGLCCKHFIAGFVLDFILDVWMLANLISLRSHGAMITGYDFRIAGNMNGFWDSIFVFINFSDLLLFIVTGAFVYVWVKVVDKDKKVNWQLGVLGLVLSYALFMIKPYHFNNIWGLQLNVCDQLNVTGEGREHFAGDYTLMANLVAEASFYATLDDIPVKPELTLPQREMIDSHLSFVETKDSLQDNLIIILFESLEGWVLNKSINGQEITPNLNKLAKENSIYGASMSPQTQRGTSSDAQLTVNTGLLPLVYEAVCYAYPDNKYYSVADAMAQLGSHNVMRIPTDGIVWNQCRVSDAWGYPTLHSKVCSDEELFDDMVATIDTIREPFCLQTMTMASHAPFWKYAGESSLKVPEDGLPTSKINYIKAVNYTDKCIGKFLDAVKENPKMKNTTVLIVGDHTIFNSNRQEFADSETGKALGAADTDFVPFVIHSPKNIKSSVEVKDTVYHMDIYPTLLGLLKLDSYPWRGVGCDMRKPLERPVPDWKLLEMCEWIIRSDYFAGKKN